MADRPILFKAPMIRALLSGRKTMDRSVLKPQPLPRFKPTHFKAVGTCNRTGRKVWEAHDQSGPMCPFPGPPGCLEWHVNTVAPGDRLWVREAWCAWSQYDDTSPARIPSCTDVQYAADEPISPWVSRARSSIHMPRWASRLTLEVTDVKVERLQEISEKDAVAEGCLGRLGPPDEWDQSPREEFVEVWKESYGADAWEANPWVAVISFTVHHANIDALARKEAAE